MIRVKVSVSLTLALVTRQTEFQATSLNPTSHTRYDAERRATLLTDVNMEYRGGHPNICWE